MAGVFRRLFRLPPQSQSLAGALSAQVGPVNADLAVTEANDTLAALVTLDLLGALAATEADDVPSAASVLAITASTFGTEADDTLAADATLAIVGNVSLAEGDDAPSAAGALDIVATLAAVEQDDGIAASANLIVGASLAVTEEDDALSASALMPILYPRRGGDDEWAKYERRQREWDEQLRQIIDRSWRIANGEIDPVTFERIPPPDHSAVVGELINQALTIDQARAEAFMAAQERFQEEEAIAILLVAA